jgi:hypothetical protein
MNKADCPHDRLRFASGDYYIFCVDCIKYWCCNPKGDGALEGQDWPSTACVGGERLARGVS